MLVNDIIIEKLATASSDNMTGTMFQRASRACLYKTTDTRVRRLNAVSERLIYRTGHTHHCYADIAIIDIIFSRVRGYSSYNVMSLCNRCCTRARVVWLINMFDCRRVCALYVRVDSRDWHLTCKTIWTSRALPPCFFAGEPGKRVNRMPIIVTTVTSGFDSDLNVRRSNKTNFPSVLWQTHNTKMVKAFIVYVSCSGNWPSNLTNWIKNNIIYRRRTV